MTCLHKWIRYEIPHWLHHGERIIGPWFCKFCGVLFVELYKSEDRT